MIKTMTERKRHSFYKKTDKEIKAWINNNTKRLYDRFIKIINIEILRATEYNKYKGRKLVFVTIMVHEPFWSGT